MTALLVAITVYAGPYVGQPLYCGGTYTTSTPAWVAMPDSFWDSGGQCWDTVGIWSGGELHVFPVRDRVARGDWYVIQQDGVWLPIAADVPAHLAWWDGLSTTGIVDNQSARQREWLARQGQSVY